MADETEGDELDAGWTAKLDKLERLLPDEPDEEGDFIVEYELQAPGLNGTITVMIADTADEGEILRTALAKLQDGLEIWARVVGRRAGSERAEPMGE